MLIQTIPGYTALKASKQQKPSVANTSIFQFGSNQNAWSVKPETVKGIFKTFRPIRARQYVLDGDIQKGSIGKTPDGKLVVTIVDVKHPFIDSLEINTYGKALHQDEGLHRYGMDQRNLEADIDPQTGEITPGIHTMLYRYHPPITNDNGLKDFCINTIQTFLDDLLTQYRFDGEYAGQKRIAKIQPSSPSS